MICLQDFWILYCFLFFILQVNRRILLSSLLTPVSLTLLIDLIVYYGVLRHMLQSPELTHFPITADGGIWYIPHNGIKYFYQPHSDVEML